MAIDIQNSSQHRDDNATLPAAQPPSRWEALAFIKSKHSLAREYTPLELQLSLPSLVE
jgi:hypothetical protein